MSAPLGGDKSLIQARISGGLGFHRFVPVLNNGPGSTGDLNKRVRGACYVPFVGAMMAKGCGSR